MFSKENDYVPKEGMVLFKTLSLPPCDLIQNYHGVISVVDQHDILWDSDRAKSLHLHIKEDSFSVPCVLRFKGVADNFWINYCIPH